MLCWRQHWATTSQAVEPGALGKENKAAGPGELGLGSFHHMGPEEVALTEMENGGRGEGWEALGGLTGPGEGSRALWRSHWRSEGWNLGF